MIHKNIYRTGLSALAMAVAIAYVPSSNAALATYSTDFESAPSGGGGFTPIGDGWLVYVNQFDGAGGYAGGYAYNGGAAPSDGPQTSAINTSEAGPGQGNQVLSVYSDYDNRTFQENGNPAAVETLVYQDQAALGAETWYFGFDAKAGSIADPASAEAFIKVLDGGYQPIAGGLITLDTSAGNLTTDWQRYEIAVDFSALNLATAVRTQFGFQTLTGNDVASDNFYDNITWQTTSSLNPVPVPAAVWLFGSGLLGLVGVARRKSRS